VKRILASFREKSDWLKYMVVTPIALGRLNVGTLRLGRLQLGGRHVWTVRVLTNIVFGVVLTYEVECGPDRGHHAPWAEGAFQRVLLYLADVGVVLVPVMFVMWIKPQRVWWLHESPVATVMRFEEAIQHQDLQTMRFMLHFGARLPTVGGKRPAPLP